MRRRWRCGPDSDGSPASGRARVHDHCARRPALLDEAGGFAIANLLRDLGEGVDFNAAFLHRMQRNFEDFQAQGF